MGYAVNVHTSQRDQLDVAYDFADIEKKIDVQQTQIEYRDAIGLKYGENTQTITFLIDRIVVFVVKTSHPLEIKATMHTYWKEQNIYISSQYRQGEHVRLVIIEDNNRVIQNRNFYIASGFKFRAQENKVYTIKFLDEGKVNKLLAMQMSKSSSAFEKAATLDQYQDLAKKIASVGQQIRSLFTISEFSDIMHEKNSVSVNHTTCLYMSYLMVEAGMVLIIVFLQIRYMTKILSEDSIV